LEGKNKAESSSSRVNNRRAGAKLQRGMSAVKNGVLLCAFYRAGVVSRGVGKE
jgi:hypothetical protein